MQTEQFGIAHDGANLYWSFYPALNPGPQPIVLLWHGGGWRNGNRNWMDAIALDLAAAGFNAASCDYELTKVSLPGQRHPCFYPNQHPQAQMAVQAARSDSRCNGRVFGLGSSAGATHSATVAILGVAAQDRVDASVALSGCYNFANRDCLKQYAGQGNWLREVLAYNRCTVTDTEILLENSTITKVTSSDISPLFMVQADSEAVGPPTSQMPELAAALDAVGMTSYQQNMVEGAAHAGDNWLVVNPNTGNLIRDDVIAFFNSYV